VSAGAIVAGIAIEVAKEAIDWAVDKVKTRAKEKLGEAVNAIDPRVLEALVTAQLALIFRDFTGVEGFDAEIAAAEARGKAHPLGGDAIEWIEEK
jgi:hypothetical protein